MNGFGKIVVFYDSWCPICKNVKINIGRFDCLHLIELQSIRENLEGTINVPLEKLEKEMYCLNKKNNHITVGIEAIASITARLPLFMILWLPIKLSSLLGIGSCIYKYIARTRKIIPVNNCDSSSCVYKKE